MISDPYSAKVRDYFGDPAHSGDLADAAVGYFADQGVRLRIAATVANGRITALRFRAWACPHVIAAAEAVCRQYEGREPRELEEFNTAQIMQTLSIPVEKTGRILVLEDTLRSLRQAIEDRAAQ